MILAVDVGTTILKAALFSDEGGLRKGAEKPLTLAPNTDPLRHEIDAGSWITALRAVWGRLSSGGGADLSSIVVSGNGPTVVPAGDDGMPLDVAMTWMDRRCTEEAAEVSAHAGFYVDPTFYLPKALWIFKNRKEIYDRTKYFFSCSEYINYLLTGKAYTILPVPEYRDFIWTEKLVSALGMDWRKFPGFISPADYIGNTSDSAFALFGIPRDVPVFAGGPDFIVSLIGTATVAPGRACDRAGTSEGINLCTGNLIQDPRLICVSHVIKGLYNISGPISTTGKALEWIKKITGKEHVSYEELFKDIENLPAGSGSLVFLPYLTGERAPIWDSDARGVFMGLTLSHGRQEMTRAVVESVGFAIRHVLSVMEDMGLEIMDLRITGSQAKSGIWNQIKADITGKNILVPMWKESELTGDMCIALYRMGKYPDLASAADSMVKIEKIYSPDPANRETYDRLFGVYRDSYEGLKEVFKKLSAPINNKEKIG
ncbi:MAG: hypothetical protein E4H36_15295 [Spirochaetales bacterium]|nr:MAG: hypothetical protein E4H36_15295 [Spirochaetales bacterium]